MGRVGAGNRTRPRATQALNRPALLDASFLIDLEREVARRDTGPAVRFLAALRGRRLLVSVVSIEEILEGASNEASTLTALQKFTIQGLHLAQARRCALQQRRAAPRLGENDAWIVATAETLDADVVGADRPAFERLGERYLRFR